MIDRELSIDRGRRTGTPSRDKVRNWKQEYIRIRPLVLTDTAAYQTIAREDEDRDRIWDYRTVRKHIEKELPLGPANALRAAADFVSFMESKYPLQRVLDKFEEAAPIKDVAVAAKQAVSRFLTENPRPDQGLRVLANLLAGGFPLDYRNQ